MAESTEELKLKVENLDKQVLHLGRCLHSLVNDMYSLSKDDGYNVTFDTDLVEVLDNLRNDTWSAK